MAKTLRPGGGAIATWPTVDANPSPETLDAAKHSPDARKWAHYLPIYESLIDRTRPIRMLEIGSFYGDSVRMWHEYLHRDSTVLSIDVSAKLAKIADSRGIHVRIDEDSNASTFPEICDQFGPFDVIIDAGSLTSHQMADSFCHLFTNTLKDGGVYLAEDVYCDYWMFFNRFSFTDFFKGLIDAAYGHYQIATDEINFRVSPLVIARRTALGTA